MYKITYVQNFVYGNIDNDCLINKWLSRNAVTNRRGRKRHRYIFVVDISEHET